MNVFSHGNTASAIAPWFMTDLFGGGGGNEKSFVESA
jgi:hypothetical protein